MDSSFCAAFDRESQTPETFSMLPNMSAPISGTEIGARMPGVCDSLSNAAQNELSNLVTLFLGITVGATMTAENILTFDVLKDVYKRQIGSVAL